jgi:hypothetical protein
VANNIGLHLALLIPLALAAWIAVAAPALRAPQATSQLADPSARPAAAGIP